jgi:hypothetical protein
MYYDDTLIIANHVTPFLGACPQTPWVRFAESWVSSVLARIGFLLKNVNY